jgi:DNA-binding response OmpR family regulator
MRHGHSGDGAGVMMSRKRILIVDDSATSVLWQRMILSKEPYDLITARDGQEGVEAAVAEPPDLILMEVVMPRMNGFEACRALRANARTKAVPVIMVTTRSEVQSVEEGWQSGCSDYITKPIDKLELLEKVRSYLAA